MESLLILCYLLMILICLVILAVIILMILRSVGLLPSTVKSLVDKYVGE